jgi:hypothetical protein
MAYNPEQYKAKKKRAVDPNAPPRPNLLSQDKKLRETTQAFEILQDRVRRQAEEIDRLKINYANMQQSINQMINLLRKGN